MTLWDNDTAALATGGTTRGKWQAARVEIDSRRVQPGDLFVAIKGDNHDGHAFVADALAKGAAAAMVHKAQPQPQALLVDDTLKSLQKLAHAARARTQAKVVGVTGSVGKTGTKEMLRVALAAHGKTYATSGNYNNHIGLPLSIANMPLDTRYAVFEMGMNHAGEISHLTALAKPDVSIITTIEAVHSEFFPSVEAIADAKAEIFESMKAGSIAVLNHHNAHYARLEKAAKAKGLKVLSVGRDAGCDCRVISAAEHITADIVGKKITYHLPALGAHMVANSLLVLAAVHALGLDVQRSADALSTFEEPAGRGLVRNVVIDDMAVTLIDDSYNASPASMRAAFAKTEELWARSGSKGRKVAVLGDMLELGKDSERSHSELAAALSGFDRVFTSGALMQHLHQSLPASQRAFHATGAEALLPELKKALLPGDIILIKGSHGSKMHMLAKALLSGGVAQKHAV